MARVGSLSPKTYWPATGDMLDDTENGITWECCRANTFYDDVTETKHRYAFLIGRMAGFDEPMPLAVHDSDDGQFEQLLIEADVIHRRKGDSHIEYHWNEASETWRQA